MRAGETSKEDRSVSIHKELYRMLILKRTVTCCLMWDAWSRRELSTARSRRELLTAWSRREILTAWSRRELLAADDKYVCKQSLSKIAKTLKMFSWNLWYVISNSNLLILALEEKFALLHDCHFFSNCSYSYSLINKLFCFRLLFWTVKSCHLDGIKNSFIIWE